MTSSRDKKRAQLLKELCQAKLNYNAIVYDPSTNKEALNIFEDELYNFSYKAVMVYKKKMKSKQIEQALLAIEYTGYYDKDKVSRISTYLSQQRFSSNEIDPNYQAYLEGRLTAEELNTYYEKTKKFCHFGDFDLIYGLFLERYNIDLIDDDIDWFRYTFLLNNLMEEKSNSLIKRIQARSFKPQKGQNARNRQGEKLRKIYSYGELEDYKFVKQEFEEKNTL